MTLAIISKGNSSDNKETLYSVKEQLTFKCLM